MVEKAVNAEYSTALASTTPAGPVLDLETVCQRHPGISLRTLRHWIAESKPKLHYSKSGVVEVPGNGFDAAFSRVGRRIYIYEDRLLQWLWRRQVQEDNA